METTSTISRSPRIKSLEPEWTNWHERHADKIELVAGIDCWLWSAASGARGYGRVHYRGHAEFAHRAAFLEAHQRETAGLIRHLCGASYCVRTSHLMEGTSAENARDMAEMFTSRSDLSREQVISIRQMYRDGISLGDIATTFGIAYGSVYPIVIGKSFRYVEGADPGARRAPRKLSSADVAEIRSLLSQGKLSQRAIGARFGVRQGQISRIKTGVRHGT